MTQSERALRVCAAAVCVAALLAGSAARALAQSSRDEETPTRTLVQFTTEDGLTMQATLHLPKSPKPPMAAAILLAQPGWTLRSTFDGANVARDLAGTQGMAALTVDFRGTASNVHGKMYDLYSPADRDKLQLDVRGAVKFLASRKDIDPERIGILATGVGVDYALREAAEQPSVQALVLVSGLLSDASRDFIRRRPDIPIMCLVGGDDERVSEMTNAFALSSNKDSRIVVAASGRGTAVFSRTKGLSEEVAAWLGANVKGLGTNTRVSFKTEDGWTLHGQLRVPDGAAGAAVPAVLLVHGAMHDQNTYHGLSRALAKKGIATFRYDWRGKNRDVNEGKGHYAVDLPAADEANTHLDVKAALAFLASQKGIDPDRIGVVGATWGTVHAFHGVADDTRVRAMAMLSQYVLDDKIRDFLRSSDVPIFFIASAEDLNFAAGNLSDFTREAYQLSKSRGTEFLLYDNAGRGSEMLKTKPDLERMLVRWFADKLGAKVPAPVTASR